MQCTKPVQLKIGKVPCGKCRACRIGRAREWSTRMMHELDYHDKSSFITLTYDNDHLPSDFGLHKRHLQLFIKRLRKDVEPLKIKYYACGEYGELSGRPHYHAILFGIDDLEIIERNWPYGFAYSGTVTYDSCRYVADYVQKKYNGKTAIEKYGTNEIPFQLQSQGLGKNWALDNDQYIRMNKGGTIYGRPVGTPRYYKKLLHIVTDENDAILRMVELENTYKRLNVPLLARGEYYLNSNEQRDYKIKQRHDNYKKGSL